MDLAKSIYIATDKLPSSERFGLVGQMRRAAVRILSNIAEGAGRLTVPDFRHLFSMALSSSNELTTQVILSEMLEFWPLNTSIVLQDSLDKNQRMLHKLIQPISKNN